MRNFEKDFDRLLNNLKEATTILKECNLEMQKCLGETKSIKYVLKCKEFGRFYNDTVDMWFNSFDSATIYPTAEQAQKAYEKCLEEWDYNDTIEIVQVQLKVVE